MNCRPTGPFSVALLALSLAAPLAAQRLTGPIQVLVAPDHSDWQYAIGEKATFVIRAIRDGRLLTGIQLTYSIGPEQMAPAVTATVALDGEPLRIDGGTMKEPGFLRLTAAIEENGRTYRGLGTAAFEPQKIQAYAEQPADFDAFWQAGKDELAALPIDARRTLIPELSTAKVNVYQVSLQNVGKEKGSKSRLFGMLAEPKLPGKYPALLGTPGAGVWKHAPLVKLAEAGAITLNIGIHGVPLTLDDSVYPLLFQGALYGYWTWGIESRDRYYYRRAILGCLRAVDYLASLPDWDGKTLAVTGESQGGALAIMTAALDARVKALAAFYPAFSDLAAYLKGRAGGWPEMFKEDGPRSMRTPANLETEPYYDTVNFARRVRVPGLYIWGYNDEVCSPTSMYAAYNAVQAPKKLLLSLPTGHFRLSEENDLVDNWLGKFLATGQAPEDY